MCIRDRISTPSSTSPTAIPRNTAQVSSSPFVWSARAVMTSWWLLSGQVRAEAALLLGPIPWPYPLALIPWPNALCPLAGPYPSAQCTLPDGVILFGGKCEGFPDSGPVAHFLFF